MKRPGIRVPLILCAVATLVVGFVALLWGPLVRGSTPAYEGPPTWQMTAFCPFLLCGRPGCGELGGGPPLRLGAGAACHCSRTLLVTHEGVPPLSSGAAVAVLRALLSYDEVLSPHIPRAPLATVVGRTCLNSGCLAAPTNPTLSTVDKIPRAERHGARVLLADRGRTGRVCAPGRRANARTP